MECECKKKKVAMIVNSNIYSGLEKVASEIMIDLSSDYEFIYVTKDGPVVERIKELDLNYYLVDDISIKSLKNFIKEWEPDIIHAHDFKASTIVAMCGFENFIVHLHNNPLWLRKICINSFAYLFFGIRAKIILGVSDSVNSEYIFHRFIENKFINIGNPLSVNEIYEKVTRNTAKKFDVCCVGRIEEQKNPLRYLEIIKELKSKRNNIKACWVGEGSLIQECKEYIKKNDLEDNVFFLGYMKNPYEIMNESKIFMLTSSWEGFGLVAFEALCFGLPCIVSNVGGLKSVIDESCGFFCEKNKDFICATEDLLNDAEQYGSMSLAAFEKAKRLDNRKTYMQNIASIYKEILERING